MVYSGYVAKMSGKHWPYNTVTCEQVAIYVTILSEGLIPLVLCSCQLRNYYSKEKIEPCHMVMSLSY